MVQYLLLSRLMAVIFFIGTGSGLFCVGIEKGELKQIPDEVVKSIVTPVHELYYHTVSKQLFVGSYKEGILIYDIGKTQKSLLVMHQTMWKLIRLLL